MMNKQLMSWLKLCYTKNVGPVTFWQALSRFQTPESALNWLTEKGRAATIPSDLAMYKIIEDCHRQDVLLVPGYDGRYPERLKAIKDAPAVLFVKGRVETLVEDCIAVVGARNCSFSAKKQTQILSESLGKAGFVVVSGLARGIDYAAHKGSLESGTIAVLAGGVDVIYPPEHIELYDQIQKNGCIVSEMPLRTKPSPNHFPRRNRVISGLSRGVIVVEAALKSGSLITAKYAIDQARELFSVPGSPQDPRCHGTNFLLKQGAHFVQSLEDIIQILKPEFDLSSIEEPDPLPYVASVKDFSIPESLKETLLYGLSTIPVDLDFIATDLSLSPQEVLAVVLELELEGLIVRQSNGTVSLSAFAA